MSEEKQEESVVVVAEDVVSEPTLKVESISSEDLAQIKELKEKVVKLATEADKLVKEAKIAELEANNFVMSVFLKHGIRPTEDQVLNSGEIVRGALLRP